MAKKQAKNAQVSVWLRVALPLMIVAIWFAAGAIGGPYFGRVGEVSSNDQTSFLPASSEATKVQEQVADFRSEESIPALVVLTRPDALTTADRDYFGSLPETLGAVDGVNGAVSPAIASADNQAALLVVPVDSQAEVGDVTAAIEQKLEVNKPTGLESYVTGPAGFLSDLKTAFGGIDGLLLLVAVGAVFIILLIVYRSPLLPIIVLLTSVFALSASILVVWWLARAGVVTLNGQVQGILFILVIGAATDYSLLYTARFREELHRYTSVWQATKHAWKNAYEPIVASGGTVIVGLLCLLLSDLNSNKALGPVGAIGIGFSILAALTLLPSLLLLAGRVGFWPFRPKVGKDQRQATTVSDSGVWPAIAGFVAAKPRVIWMTGLVVLLIGAAGVTQFKASGVPQSDLILGSSQARDGQVKLGQHFPGGFGSPATIIASNDKQDELVAAAARVQGVDSVSALSKTSPSGMLPLGDDAPKFGPFSGLKPTIVGGRIALQVTLDDAADSTAAERTIVALRTALQRVDSTAIVGGVTATNLDTNNASIRDRTIIIPIVLVIITLILMMLLRAVVAPLLLMALTVISFATALGVSAWVFNGIFQFPGADPSVPLFGFVFLVALGIDYNIFLMTRVREESLKYGAREGILRGLIVTGGIITSAGVVLAATFAALAVIPILFLAQLAFIVAFGVLLDALLVRSLIVPALVRDIGALVWWPSNLSRSIDPKPKP
ncbi:MAG: MMPL family transporter [Candidatus Saccharimonadales bacterium]